jgi:hypothetical protein
MSDPIQSLAERLYIDIIGRIAIDPADPEKIRKFNPDGIARLCFKLADVFHKAQEVRTGEPDAKGAKYEVQLSDIAAWGK